MRTLGLLWFSLLMLAWVCPGYAVMDEPGEVVSRKFSLDLQGRMRTYRLFVPPKLMEGEPSPLVLVFHGAGSSAEEIEKLTQFNRIALKERFLVAYPQGLFRNWNDGRGPLASLAHLDNVNDLAFIDSVIRDIARQHPLDRRRVFATGLSNGGGFAHYLAAERPDLIAAIATVGGSIAQPLANHFDPHIPVSVFLIHGTHDPITPAEGGGVLRGFRGRVLGAMDSAKLWSKANGCADSPEIGALENRVNDACSTRWYRWRGEDQSGDVILFLVEGMGHNWPGRDPYMAEQIIGRTCYDFDASQVIWRFFKEHPGGTSKRGLTATLPIGP